MKADDPDAAASVLVLDGRSPVLHAVFHGTDAGARAGDMFRTWFHALYPDEPREECSRACADGSYRNRRYRCWMLLSVPAFNPVNDCRDWT